MIKMEFDGIKMSQKEKEIYFSGAMVGLTIGVFLGVAVTYI